MLSPYDFSTIVHTSYRFLSTKSPNCSIASTKIKDLKKQNKKEDEEEEEEEEEEEQEYIIWTISRWIRSYTNHHLLVPIQDRKHNKSENAQIS